MHNLALIDFDSLQDQFEEQWSLEASGVEFIKQFLTTTVSQDAQKLARDRGQWYGFIKDLVEIDIERWWIRWEDRVARRNDETTADELIQIFAGKATTENYLELLPGPVEDDVFWKELIEAEIAIRERLGDRIGSKYFNRRFGLNLDEKKSRSSLVLRVDLESENSIKHSPIYQVRGCTLIGRQRLCDPSSSMVKENADGNRIVVADARQDRNISRKQLTIQVLTPSTAIIRNLSKINSVTISPNTVLPVEQGTLMDIPFSIRLPGRKLRCYHTSESIC